MDKKQLSIWLESKKMQIEYEFQGTYIFGIKLTSLETKDMFNKKVQINNAYCYYLNGVSVVRNMNIHCTGKVDRLILLKKNEINKIINYTKLGYVMIVTKILKYNNLFKLEVKKAKKLKKHQQKRREIILDCIKRETRKGGTTFKHR